MSLFGLFACFQQQLHNLQASSGTSNAYCRCAIHIHDVPWLVTTPRSDYSGSQVKFSANLASNNDKTLRMSYLLPPRMPGKKRTRTHHLHAGKTRLLPSSQHVFNAARRTRAYGIQQFRSVASDLGIQSFKPHVQLEKEKTSGNQCMQQNLTVQNTVVYN